MKITTWDEDFEWPIYIDVVDGKVTDIWYVNAYGQDRLLPKDEYDVRYETTKKSSEPR